MHAQMFCDYFQYSDVEAIESDSFFVNNYEGWIMTGVYCKQAAGEIF
jgi:hypothetical protein